MQTCNAQRIAARPPARAPQPALAGDLQWPYNGASLRHSCARSAGAGAEGGEALVFDPITSEVRALPAGGARAAALQRPSRCGARVGGQDTA